MLDSPPPDWGTKYVICYCQTSGALSGDAIDPPGLVIAAGHHRSVPGVALHQALRRSTPPKDPSTACAVPVVGQHPLHWRVSMQGCECSTAIVSAGCQYRFVDCVVFYKIARRWSYAISYRL